MVYYSHSTNRRSLSLRYKRYIKLKTDLWGRMAILNKRTKIVYILKSFGEKVIKHRDKRIHRKKFKKRRFLERFGLWVHKWKRKASFQYQILKNPNEILKNLDVLLLHGRNYNLLEKKCVFFIIEDATKIFTQNVKKNFFFKDTTS